MQMLFLIPVTLLEVCRCAIIVAGVANYMNLTDYREYRQKRSLIFEGGGTIKLVVGPTLPVNLGDPITWRSVVCSHTLQGGQYPIIATPQYPWDKWEDTFARSFVQNPAARKHQFDSTNIPRREDDSRLFVYTLLESYMSQDAASVDGRECLLRAICENAQTAQHVGLLAELVNILLTPNKESGVDPIYSDAYEAGRSGVDCLELHKKCPLGISLFDQYMDDL